MKVSEWRHQKRAEGGAGFLEQQHLFQGKLECATCGIFIGKDHHEQELYLYPVWGEEVKVADAHKHFKHLMVFLMCGGCADKRGIVDDLDLMVFDHRIWHTHNTLVQSHIEEIRQRFEREAQYVLWLSHVIRRLCGRIPPWSWWLQWITPIAFAPILHIPPQVPEARAYTTDISHMFAGMHASSLLPYAS